MFTKQNHRCKDCTKKYLAEYKMKNKDKNKIYQLTYRAKQK